MAEYDSMAAYFFHYLLVLAPIVPFSFFIPYGFLATGYVLVYIYFSKMIFMKL